METISLKDYKILHKKVAGNSLSFANEKCDILSPFIVCPLCEQITPQEFSIYELHVLKVCPLCKHEFAIIKEKI